MKLFKYFSSYFFTIIAMGFIGYLFYQIHIAFGYSVLFVMLLSAYCINLVMVLFVFIQKRQNSAKLSWIMVMAILPFVGHVLFIIFGKKYSGRVSIEKYHKRKNFKSEKFIGKSNEDKLMKLQSKFSNRGIYNSDFKLFKYGNDAYNKLFFDMTNAKKFIHLHFYIVKPGEIYDQFKKILIQKAKEGVEIRMIVDDFGRWALPWYAMNDLIKKGVEVKIFSPVHFPFISSHNGYRTHRKMAIIDGSIVHTGGLNIADEYASLDKKYGLWIDLHARITGGLVRSYSLLFIHDWMQMTNQWLKPKKYIVEKNNIGTSKSIMIEDSPEIDMEIIENSITRLIQNSKKTITICTPYLIPSQKIIDALITAANSGIKVTLYIPDRADKIMPYKVTKYFAHVFLQNNIVVRKIEKMFIHSKIGIFDEKYAYFGTANIDYRSLYSQFEIINIVTGQVVKDIKNIFKYYESFSKKIEIKDLNIKNWAKNLLKFYVNLFSPMM